MFLKNTPSSGVMILINHRGYGSARRRQGFARYASRYAPLSPSAPPVFCSYVVAGRGESRMRNLRDSVLALFAVGDVYASPLQKRGLRFI